MQRYGLSLLGDRQSACPRRHGSIYQVTRFYEILTPLTADQARGWANTAIEAITKITGTITRQ
jgi:hypothetical protein